MTDSLEVIRFKSWMQLEFPLCIFALAALMLALFLIFYAVTQNRLYQSWDNHRKAKYLVEVNGYTLVEICRKLYLAPQGVNITDYSTTDPRIWRLNTLTFYSWREIRQGCKEEIKTPKLFELLDRLTGGK